MKSDAAVVEDRVKVGVLEKDLARLSREWRGLIKKRDALNAKIAEKRRELAAVKVELKGLRAAGTTGE